MNKETQNQNTQQEPKKVNNKPLVAVCCVLAAAVIAVGAWIGVLVWQNYFDIDDLQKMYPGEPLKALTVDAIVEQGNQIVVQTSYGEIRYPFAFSDLICVEAYNLGGATALNFKAELNSGSHRIFTIWFNREAEIVLGTLNLDGQEVTVSADIADEKHKISEEELNSFFAAQECFNEVVDSLQLLKGFTPAQ